MYITPSFTMGMEWVIALSKLNVNQAIKNVLSRQDVQNQIVELNTQVQLFQEGENSFGVKLSSIGGGYSPFTKQIKLSKGQPINRITLKDTGEFYKSFRVNVFSNGDFEIVANPIKDDTNLFDEWGEEITGLQKQHLNKVLKLVESSILDEILKGVSGHIPIASL